MLNADWLVQVYAHDNDGDPCIGTGYSIGSGLVLTARHVVRFDKRADNPQLKLVWPEQDKHEMPFTDADIEFDGFDCEPNIDVAVIRCPQATPFKPPQVDWLLTVPVPTTAWSGRGFPRAAKEPTIRDDLGMSGTVAGLKKHVVELTTDVDAIEANGWAGFSGSPVFIGQQLAAVITHDYSSLEGYFKAVSIRYLLEHVPAFRQAVGLNDNAIAIQKFVDGQKQQIEAQLKEMQSGSLCQELVKRLDVKVADHLAEHLLVAFDQDNLGLLDTLLKASIEALKHASDKHGEASRIRQLFFLFVSLMTPQSVLARETVMNLSVRTRMATELHLAPAYDVNPAFDLDKDGLPKGCWAEDASVFVRETGWDIAKQVDEAIKVIDTQVRKKPRSKLLDEFECEELNETLKQRQSREHGKLHRIELDQRDEAMKGNPFADEAFCKALKAADCLPDLPIVYYGKVAAPQEAKLRAKLRELFEILQRYGYAA